MKSPETVFPPPISLWVGNPTGFSSQSLYPVTAPCLAAVPSRSCFCRLAHEKGSSRLLLGPHSPQGPTSHFPPPARSLGQCLGRCVISPSGTPPQRPSGEWIVQAPSEGFSSCLFCRAFVGMSPFPSLGTSARSPQPQVCLRHRTSSLCPYAVQSTWLWSLPFSWQCFLKHQTSASCTVC